LSIMQKQKRKDPKLGYATDFVDLMARTLPQIKAKGIRVIANAGGVNPEACRTAIMEVAKKLGVTGLKIATVTGDDVLERLEEFKAKGLKLANIDTGAGLFDEPLDIISANVYMPTQCMVEALDAGADIVLTGRCTDPGLTLAPLMHEFKWSWEDWDRLAAGTVAGHILECGAQSTGGNFTRWWEVPELWNVGYPIAECSEDGTFVVTKPEGSGGMVTVDTVSEQLVYEMGDPQNYITPDVVADFSSIQLAPAGQDRVKVSGIKGKPKTPFLKVSGAYLKGYKATGQLTLSGPRALEKARLCADIVWKRLKAAGFEYEHTDAEYLGASVVHAGIAPAVAEPAEVVMRLSVKDASRKKVERFGRELAPLVTAGPAGVTGFAGGRPKAAEIVAYWPALIPRGEIRWDVTVEET
ncbi:MAG TPA: acyclic terpene utilization AtuA family protein, partial [Holophagaceae bacterium]|nr:acyclic terpene utilization AtuA family protein [Holophagaceae bacterium]